MLKKTLVIMVLFMLVCTVIIPLCKAVTISPIIIDDVDIQPGEAAFRTFVVINESESEKTYFLHAKNFEPVGEEGQVTISAEEDPIGLASWIAFPVKSITLGSGQMQEIDFQIVAPPNAEPGGHYAAVFASTEPPDIDRGLGLAGNVGVLLLVRIEGDITEDIRVLEFHTRNSQNFYNRLPVFFDYRIENRGTVHVKPQGIIKLTGLFGDEVDANPNNSRSLPSSIRHIEAWWMGSSS
ncbi:hypothetical protein KJ969_03055 [Patescibacteria group bacterium]|nr:hypothetical protein [Patescibacteria group bacterium]